MTDLDRLIANGHAARRYIDETLGTLLHVKALGLTGSPTPPSTPPPPIEEDTDIDIDPDVPVVENDQSLENLTRAPRLWIWRENSPANDFGAEEAIVVATKGKAGAGTVRIICANGDPVVDADSMVKRTEQAKREGCIAVCIDLESYFIREGQHHAEWVYECVSEILPLLWAPKAFNDHLIKHWKMKDFQAAARWLGDNGDGQIAWAYSRPDATQWFKLAELTRKSGNKDLYVPLGDFAQRTSGGAYTKPFTRIAIENFHNYGHHVGVFMPDHGTWTTIVQNSDAWKTSVELYG